MTSRLAAFASFVLPLILATAHPLPAQTSDHSAHTGHAAGADNDATRAYAEINARMHEAIALPFTGNVDVDFIRGMIPHHQGAVDMARVVLEHGTDPEVRALAETIIAAQETEIAWMQDRLAKNGF